METEQAFFQSLAEKLIGEDSDISVGPMMSSPGLKYKNKVFAFFHNKEMIFRLGKQFDPGSMGFEQYQLLSPFKNKPPLSGWFQIPFEYSAKYEKLARQALHLISSETPER